MGKARGRLIHKRPARTSVHKRTSNMKHKGAGAKLKPERSENGVRGSRAEENVEDILGFTLEWLSLDSVEYSVISLLSDGS